MENIEKNTVASKFVENPYVEMKKKISMNGVFSVLIAILAFAGSSILTDPQSSLKLFLLGKYVLRAKRVFLLKIPSRHCFLLLKKVYKQKFVGECAELLAN